MVPGSCIYCLRCSEIQSTDHALVIFTTAYRRVEHHDIPLGICKDHEEDFVERED